MDVSKNRFLLIGKWHMVQTVIAKSFYLFPATLKTWYMEDMWICYIFSLSSRIVIFITSFFKKDFFYKYYWSLSYQQLECQNTMLEVTVGQGLLTVVTAFVIARKLCQLVTLTANT